jgi:hypothetical protein
MENKSDAILRKMLKKMVNRQHPPDNGRARLLWDAAHISSNKFDLTIILFHPQAKSYSSSAENDWHQKFFSWINENSIQFGIQARII